MKARNCTILHSFSDYGKGCQLDMWFNELIESQNQIILFFKQSIKVKVKDKILYFSSNKYFLSEFDCYYILNDVSAIEYIQGISLFLPNKYIA